MLTYSRRGSRFTPSQQESWDAHHAKWVIEDHEVDQPGFDLAARFGRKAPLIIEIGSGIGEATAVLAAARPDHDVLALEVWMPGVAHTLGLLDQAGAENVRMLGVDAGHAGLLIERRGFLRDGRAAEFTRSYYRGDAYDFVAELADS